MLRSVWDFTMRSAIFLLLMLPPLVAQKQPDVWKRVDPNSDLPRLQFATVSKVQQTAIAQLILHCCQGALVGTQGSAPTDVIRCLSFQEIPLSKESVLLISEDDTGCFQGGSGGGGAMWLVRLDGDVPILLASPEDDFSGWIYSVQPSVSHGYRDLVLGWHMGAGHTTLTYFQYNGRSYVSVSSAANLCDQNGCRIDPNISRIP